MDQQPTQPQIPALTVNQTPGNKTIVSKFNGLRPEAKITALVAFLAFSLFVLLVIFYFLAAQDSKKTETKNTGANLVETERQRQRSASESAVEQQQPQNQLAKAYDAVVGSDSSKRTLNLDSSGIATIEYEIASIDGQLILKTSYENFADLASRVFNIDSLKRLNVTTYANKFTDTFGKPNIFAVKLQVTKETNSKINWSIKKYAYADFATILDYHEINPGLEKDYKTLTRKSN